MNYFRVYNSSNANEVGAFPQVYDAIVNFDIYHSNSSYYLNFTKKADSSTLWPMPKLAAKAKKTDLVSTSFIGLSGKQLISLKLYKIISKFQTKGIQFIKTELITRKGKEEEYWIVNPIMSEMDFIDYELSSFGFMNSMGNHLIEQVKFSCAKNFIEAYKSNQVTAIKNPYPNHRPLVINKIVFVENSGLDFFSIGSLIYGGIGLFVSEKLKKEIEEAGCTGVVFKEPNDIYP